MRQLKITKATTPHSQVIDSYLKEISKNEVLTSDEEVELAKRIKGGDELAREKLIKHNLKFVVSVAKRYMHQGLPLPDLINEGNIGLVKAAERFDETRGFKFISYAVWWIRQQIQGAISNQSNILRLPSNKNLDSIRIDRAEQKIIAITGREASYEELSKECNVSIETIKEVKLKTIDSEVFNFTGEEDPEEDFSIKRDIKRLFETLSEREALIIDLYFGLSRKESMTLEDIGKELNLTRERIRQVKEKAIKKLKHPKRSQLLRKYL